jgi:hypothetical protein
MEGNTLTGQLNTWKVTSLFEKVIQISTSITVLLVSAAVSLTSSLFSNVEATISSNGW